MEQGTGITAEERKKLDELLGDRANYVLLKDSSKEPIGRYRKNTNGRARVSSLPATGNYGILPSCGWFILDLDTHRGSIEGQKKIFEELFNVNLDETLQVLTPSGGIHYYLRLPSGYDGSIFNGSLRSYAKQILENSSASDEIIDADIRSSEATGYVVGPGSYVSIGKGGTAYETPGYYSLIGDSRHILNYGKFKGLAEISPGGVEFLRHLREIQLAKRNPLKDASAEEKAEARRENAEQILHESAPQEQVLSRLASGLRKRFPHGAEFHRQRAFTLAALRCCYSDYAIAVACVKLGIDKDSYTEERSPFWETLSDIASLRVDSRLRHGRYCDVGHQALLASRGTPEELIERARKRILERPEDYEHKPRNPRVIDMNAVARMLDKGGDTVPQQVLDAFLIIDMIFQPLCNIGASRIIVARKPVAEKLKLTASRMSAAMRLLRKSGIIVVKNRQRTGLTSTYDIDPRYLHKFLSGSIRYRWTQIKKKYGREATLVYSRFENRFYELGTENTFRIGGYVRRDWRKELGIKPKQDLDYFAMRYLKRSKSNE